jgi:LacI family transcriptional regulator, galactose operon repressor
VSTARDIARMAGVSTSTVSHVLNNTRWVSPDLRDRVLAAAQELRYEPDTLARSLRVRRSNSIGLVISDVGNPFFTSVVRGAEDVARANGYALILCNSDEDPEKEATYLRLLIGRRVEGLILAPAGVRHDYLASLIKGGFPLVFLDRDVPATEVAAVVLDNRRAARDAVEHLIGLGHRRIGMIAGRPAISTTVDRVAGYRTALRTAGIPYDETLVISGGSRTDEARLATHRLLDLPSPPTALLVGNNLMTIGAVAGIQARGLAIPDDVSVAGIDDFSWADVFHPTLTTIAQPTYELGRSAAELVLSRIAGESAIASKRVVLRGHLVVRESTGSRLGTSREPVSTAEGRRGG